MFAMVKNIIKTSIFLVLSMMIIVSCSDDNTNQPPEEFIATDADFANYTAWTFVGERQGPDPALGAAHGGNDSTVKRYIYNYNNMRPSSDGQYPIGARLVKETHDKDGNIIGVTAMVKRGGSFNAANNDWEWFFLENGKIKDRGANLMDGACGGCHTQAKNKDYVFTVE